MRGSCRRLIGPHPENALCRLVLSRHHGFHVAVAQRTAGCSAPASSAVCTALTPALPQLIKSEGERDRKFADSLLKGTGFETAVPRKAGPVRAPLATRNRKFESTSLQQRICKLSVPLALSGITSRGAVSTKVNRMIAAASNVDPRRFREGPDIIADDFGKDDFGKIARHFRERHGSLAVRHQLICESARARA